ncbi:WD40/YVTN/BNR-like repeat-containing protein [Solirubrobacter ginsenosidimutans]|nr:hypothetical protein [Solirubrobacter ginsenosidimutans]
MKRFALLLLAGVLVLVVAPVRSVVPRPPANHVDELPLWSGVGEAESPQSMLDLASSVNGPVTEAQVKRASAQAAALPEAKSTRWQFVGPTNVGGRVIDVAVDPTTTPSTVFAAVSSGGGIMKSTDGGVTFTPSYPDDFTQSMGALARGSDGTLYAGTGEGSNPSGGGSTFMGDGIYRSTDDGDTWEFSGLPDSGAFGRIVVNPDNPKEVWAAASGSLTWVSSQRGLYHSLDGGKTWDLALSGPGDHTGAVDIALEPGNPHVILASLWDRYRNNGSFYYGGSGSGLYRSTDDGKTWTRQDNSNINGATCSWDKTKTGLNASDDLGHIGMAFAPSDPNRAYLVFATSNGPDKGYYVSNDAGQTWTCGAGEPGSTTGGYEWVFSRLWVDPANRDHVFEANVSLKVSSNAGATWSNSNGPHSDMHAMAWDPQTPGLVYLGSDGGVYRSPASGNSGTWTHAASEPWVQPYHISVSQQDPKRLAIGLQDNGSVRSWTSGVEPTDPTQWNSYGGGDGFQVQIDPTNQLRHYQCSQPTPPRISCGRRVDAAATGSTTSTSSNFTTPAWPSNTRVEVAMPMVLDPADPNYVYVAGTSIARSGDGVVNAWTIISPPIPDDPASLPGVVPDPEINRDTYYANEFGAVTAIAPAKTTGTSTTPASTIYAGTDTGLLWKTTNATAATGSDVHWTRLGAGVLPNTWVTSITVDPTNADHVYASFSSYKEGDRAANVWETTDGGTTWRNISSDLPNAPIWRVLYDQSNGVLYVAHNLGVFVSSDDGGHWYKISQGMPNAPILDLGLSADHSQLFAANYGRGVYELPLTESTGGGAGGTVPATLALTLGTPASFGAFAPGVAKDYNTSTTADVLSTAGDAALSVTDPSGVAPGHLVNGSFSLPQALQAQASSPGAGPGSAFAPLGADPITLLTWSAPISHDQVTIGFRQSIGASDALRTGSYGKTLTFTLSTTTP